MSAGAMPIMKMGKTLAGMPMSYWEGISGRFKPKKQEPPVTQKIVERLPPYILNNILGSLALGGKEVVTSVVKHVKLESLNREDSCKILEGLITAMGRTGTLTAVEVMKLVPEAELKETLLSIIEARLRPNCSVMHCSLDLLSRISIEPHERDIVIKRIFSANCGRIQYMGKLPGILKTKLAEEYVRNYNCSPETRKMLMDKFNVNVTVLSIDFGLDHRWQEIEVDKLKKIPQEYWAEPLKMALNVQSCGVRGDAIKLISELPPEEQENEGLIRAIWTHQPCNIIRAMARCLNHIIGGDKRVN